MNEEKYPSVEIAYTIALESYGQAIQRSDQIDSKIDNLMVWSTTIILAIIALIAGKDNITNAFLSYWFYAAMGLFGIFIITGIYVKNKGSLKLISPKMLYDKWLYFTVWEFKKNAIYYAGQHWVENKKFVNCKGVIYTIMTFIFLFQITFIAIWLISI